VGKYDIENCDTGRSDLMPLSLRIPPEKEKIINRAAAKAGKTKSAFILEAVDEKLGLVKDREQTVWEVGVAVVFNFGNPFYQILNKENQ
jgi:Protein of unknown function (DUF1778)